MIRYAVLALSIVVIFQNCKDPERPNTSSSLSSGTESEPRTYSFTQHDFNPRIIRHPDVYVRRRGQLVTFTVEVQTDYKSNATYNWYRNGAKLPNEFQPQLQIRKVEDHDAGIYHAVIKMGDQTYESGKGSLSVIRSNGTVAMGNPADPTDINIDNNGAVINYNWSVGAFSQCSEPCGTGSQTREVTCLQKPSGTTISTERFCTGIKPDETSECLGTRCGERQTFTQFGGVSAKTKSRTVAIKQIITADSSEMAERIFSSDCDQGKYLCGKYDRCEYIRIPGAGDNGSESFCEWSDTAEAYDCVATCFVF